MSGSPSRRRGAFTLIESVAVIAIIGVMLALVAPTLMKAFRERFLSKEMNAVRTTHLAIINYSRDRQNAGETPIYPRRLQELLADNYLTAKDLDREIVYVQPGDAAAPDFVMLRRPSASGPITCTIAGPPETTKTTTGTPAP